MSNFHANAIVGSMRQDFPGHLLYNTFLFSIFHYIEEIKLDSHAMSWVVLAKLVWCQAQSKAKNITQKIFVVTRRGKGGAYNVPNKTKTFPVKTKNDIIFRCRQRMLKIL